MNLHRIFRGALAGLFVAMYVMEWANLPDIQRVLGSAWVGLLITSALAPND